MRVFFFQIPPHAMSKMSSLFSAAEIFAQTTAPASQPGPSMLSTFLPMLLLFAAMYFLMIAPQRKKQKEHEKMLATLQSGEVRIWADSNDQRTVGDAGGEQTERVSGVTWLGWNGVAPEVALRGIGRCEAE